MKTSLQGGMFQPRDGKGGFAEGKTHAQRRLTVEMHMWGLLN